MDDKTRLELIEKIMRDAYELDAGPDYWMAIKDAVWTVLKFEKEEP